MGTKIVLGQVFGFLAMALMCLSYQINSKSKLLLVQTAGCACTCISYMLLGAMSGFVLNIACIIRNGVYCFLPTKSKKGIAAGCLIALVMGALGAVSWQGAVSLLIIGGLMINTVFMSVGDPQLLRKSILLTSSLILIYNIFVFSMGGICSEGISIVSAAIGIARFSNKK